MNCRISRRNITMTSLWLAEMAQDTSWSFPARTRQLQRSQAPDLWAAQSPGAGGACGPTDFGAWERLVCRGGAGTQHAFSNIMAGHFRMFSFWWFFLLTFGYLWGISQPMGQRNGMLRLRTGWVRDGEAILIFEPLGKTLDGQLLRLCPVACAFCGILWICIYTHIIIYIYMGWGGLGWG